MLDDRYHAGTYGIPDEQTLEAIRLAGRLEGMITDPVYEGKSMAGMIDLVAQRRDRAATANVLYAHLGGQPALSAYAALFTRLGLIPARWQALVASDGRRQWRTALLVRVPVSRRCASDGQLGLEPMRDRSMHRGATPHPQSNAVTRADVAVDATVACKGARAQPAARAPRTATRRTS